jgi:hypothetical protein
MGPMACLFYKELSERGFAVHVFKVAKVFVKTGAGRSSGLFKVFQLTCGADDTLDTGVVVFVLVGVVLVRQQFVECFINK